MHGQNFFLNEPLAIDRNYLLSILPSIIFGYKKILVAEFFNRDIGESFLSFIDTELNEKLKNIQVYGFMESMALNEKFIAWGENNKIRVIESK